MFVTVLSFNVVGDQLRALTDPRPGAMRAAVSAPLLSVERCRSSCRRRAVCCTPSTASISAARPAALWASSANRGRQDDAVARDPAAAAGKRARLADGCCSTAAISRPCRREALRDLRGPEHRRRLPGPDDLAQSGAHHRHADRRDRCRSTRHGRRAATTRGRAAGRGRHSRARAAAPAVSAPAVGRHAPARRDRHRARLRAEAADRRRADDGARRHGAGADPRPAGARAAAPPAWR